jgi:hypothetical protein
LFARGWNGDFGGSFPSRFWVGAKCCSGLSGKFPEPGIGWSNQQFRLLVSMRNNPLESGACLNLDVETK